MNEQGLLAWGTEKFGVDLFGLRGRSAFALQPEGRSLRYDCGTNPADPPRGPCDQLVAPGASNSSSTISIWSVPVSPGEPMQASRFHIRLLLGSGFPFTPQFPVMDEDGVITAVVEGERHAQRDDGYIRFDIGMTQLFRVGGLAWEVREEVANLFDEFNAVGYRQLPTPDGSMALLPRGLGRWVYNLEVSARF
jgi:hypothetical protein